MDGDSQIPSWKTNKRHCTGDSSGNSADNRNFSRAAGNSAARIVSSARFLEGHYTKIKVLVEVSKIIKSDTRVRPTNPNHTVVGNWELKFSAGEYVVNSQFIRVATAGQSMATTSKLAEDLYIYLRLKLSIWVYSCNT